MHFIELTTFSLLDLTENDYDLWYGFEGAEKLGVN
jgi:hypothetical protein